MKSLFKKPWLIGTLIFFLLILVFFINFLILSLDLTSSYSDESIFSLAYDFQSGSSYVRLFSFILMIAFYVAILPILLSGLSLIRKKNWGFILAIFYLIGFDTGLIVFQASYNYVSSFAMILIIVAIALSLLMFVLTIFRGRALNLNQDTVKEEKNIQLSSTKAPQKVLFIDLLSIIIFLSTFFIPLYIITKSGSDYYAVVVNVILFGETNLELIVYFLVNFVIFLAIFLFFSNCISHYFYDKERFIQKSKSLINLIFVSSIIFFITGLVLHMYYKLDGETSQTFAFIPMFLMCAVIFIYSIFKGRYLASNPIVEENKKMGYPRVEPLLYVILLTVVTALMLLLPIIKIEIIYDTYSHFINLTGLKVLTDYPKLDPGYRMVAFLLVVVFLASGLSLVIVINGYLAKYRQFNSLVKFAASVNVFFVFIIAVSGYYFQIAKEINQGILMDILETYGFNLPGVLDYDYKVGTDAVYALIASTAVLMVMFIRKAFDRDELGVLEANVLPQGNGISQGDTESTESKTFNEEVEQQFDPCPAFTDLDSRVELFKQDLEKRKAFKTSETTLNGLIHFVVEYARNSRLHLSYTPEDIATFVAGLGASKLSILQGMSGTGKTSLPKIFSEAVFGNCEIIEVESSWKDKNELLGYYNEFSMKYTPKKFTQALYKATLNQEIFTFILLDEMNLSRIEYYFSDFLSLMENEEGQREIKLINILLKRREEEGEVEYLSLENGNTLKVPSNVWFIGTANRDESTFVISDKVYDRAHTMNFTKRAPKVRNYTNPIPRQFYDYQTINQMFITTKQKGNFDAESSELIKAVEALLSPYNISFGNRILKQIEDFVNIYKACFPNEDVESEAIEKILLSKVVAKLEVKTIDDKEKLEMEFEKLNLKLCSSFIKRLDNE